MLSAPIIFVLSSITFVSTVDGFCTPTDACWPSKAEVESFVANLSKADNGCLPTIPVFASLDKPGDPIANPWYDDQPNIITPYALLNFRNHINDWKAYFVVLARSELDISNSVIFAAKHNISISVMSTGHEFQDRNSGSSPNSLLIRTTCLRTSELDLNVNNRFNNPDGVARFGAGLTWGTSKFKLKGVLEMAKEVGRVVVSGHAATVGIVGWTLGGGHGQLAPLHGLGVDQVLEIELIGADGSKVTANSNGTTIKPLNGQPIMTSNSSELFWALRGGGGSTWGVVVAMTVKLHKPVNSCTTRCYIQQTKVWANRFDTDDAKMATDLLYTYLNWASNASKYWSSYALLVPEKDTGVYFFIIGEALYTGSPQDPDALSLNNTFKAVYPHNLVVSNTTTFDTFYDKTLAQDKENITTNARFTNFLSALLNQTAAKNYDVAKSFVDNWIPRCYRKHSPCSATFEFHHTLASTYDMADTTLPISNSFRTAKVHATSGEIIKLDKELTYEDKNFFVHNKLAPEIYKWSDGSYFSEAEYTLCQGDWQKRFWGASTYSKLLKIKQKYDPSRVFGCRHCVGDDDSPETCPSSNSSSSRLSFSSVTTTTSILAVFFYIFGAF